MNKNLRLILSIALFSILLSACAPSAQAVQTAIAQTQAAIPNNQSTFPTLAPPATANPQATKKTLPPTALLQTATPLPTIEIKPPPKPTTLVGTGDSVTDLQKWNGPALLHARHTGSGNFVIWNYGPDGQKIDLLVNTIGVYDGYLPLDFMEGESTARFEINADGSWQLDVAPLSTAPMFDVPVSLKQKGDYVFWVNGTPDLLKANTNSDSNFVVYGYSKSQGRDLLINEIAPYSGTVMLRPDTFIIVVQAEGPWTIDITGR